MNVLGPLCLLLFLNLPFSEDEPIEGAQLARAAGINLTSKQDIAFHRGILNNDDPLLRIQAAQALENYPFPETLSLLESTLEKESSSLVRIQIVQSMERLKAAEASKNLPWRFTQNDRDEATRWQQTATSLDPESQWSSWLKLSAPARIYAVMESPQLSLSLVQLLQDPLPWIRRFTIEQDTQRPAPQLTAERLRAVLSGDSDWAVRAVAALWLVQHSKSEDRILILQTANDDQPGYLRSVSSAMGEYVLTPTELDQVFALFQSNPALSTEGVIFLLRSLQSSLKNPDVAMRLLETLPTISTVPTIAIFGMELLGQQENDSRMEPVLRRWIYQYPFPEQTWPTFIRWIAQTDFQRLAPELLQVLQSTSPGTEDKSNLLTAEAYLYGKLPFPGAFPRLLSMLNTSTPEGNRMRHTAAWALGKYNLDDSTRQIFQRRILTPTINYDGERDFDNPEVRAQSLWTLYRDQQRQELPPRVVLGILDRLKGPEDQAFDFLFVPVIQAIAVGINGEPMNFPAPPFVIPEGPIRPLRH